MTDQNKRFAKLAGICWHEWPFPGSACACGSAAKDHNPSILNPDFTDAVEVLKVMMERDDCLKFLEFIGGLDNEHGIRIPVYYVLDRTGKLRDAAIAEEVKGLRFR